MADIELVIKIPEDEYKFVQTTSFVENESTVFKQTNAERKKTLVLFDILDAIRNGKPLPENHGRLIDADALQTEMEKDVRKAMSFVDLKDFVWLAPTIIEGSEGR